MNLSDLLEPAAAWAASRSWMDWGEIFFVLMSIVGQHFISARNSVGFGFWLAGNMVAIPVFAYSGRGLTAVLYCYFAWKCVSGTLQWRRLEQKDRSEAGAPVIPALATAGSAGGSSRDA